MSEAFQFDRLTRTTLNGVACSAFEGKTASHIMASTSQWPFDCRVQDRFIGDGDLLTVGRQKTQRPHGCHGRLHSTSKCSVGNDADRNAFTRYVNTVLAVKDPEVTKQCLSCWLRGQRSRQYALHDVCRQHASSIQDRRQG